MNKAKNLQSVRGGAALHVFGALYMPVRYR
jgi:hypothetical protein